MTRLVTTMGNQIAAASPPGSLVCAVSPPHTVQDLLAALAENRYIKRLRTTARLVCECLNVGPGELTIDALESAAPRLSGYLQERRYRAVSIRCHRCFASVLLRNAKQLGWTSSRSEMTKAWEPIVRALANTDGTLGLVRYAISKERTPSTLTDDDLTVWIQMMVSQGRSYRYAASRASIFWRTLASANLAGNLPGIRRIWKSKSLYGVPCDSFPAALRQEVDALLTWKQAEYAKGRPAKSKIRSISAARLLSLITRLYGFVVNVLPSLTAPTEAIQTTPPQTLTELVTPDLVRAFIDWLLNVRGLKGPSVACQLGYLIGPLNAHPNYTGKDFTWLSRVVREIPFEPESRRWERKLRKHLPYETVADIPRRIHETRLKAAAAGGKKLAWAVHHELLMTWLVLEPWRQRNIRECKLGLRSEGANLFKAAIQPLDKIKLPKWAEVRLRIKPREELWQYYFREHETKSGRAVHAILPYRLVLLLEEYLTHHRPCLASVNDPGTLFLNSCGRRMGMQELTYLVSDLTLCHTGTRVTPHMFRDIWAYWWLESHPEDYFTVSKKLWHRKIETTVEIYSFQFNESHADSRVEDYLDSQPEGWLI